jgi:bifunctional non-homologous end joining protein LigD
MKAATRDRRERRRSERRSSGRRRRLADDTSAPARDAAVPIPGDRDMAEVDVGGRRVRLTNLRKVFWPELGTTKGDLLRYYAEISAVLLPHLRDRAMVMKRYPNGAGDDFFFSSITTRTRGEERSLRSTRSGPVRGRPSRRW